MLAALRRDRAQAGRVLAVAASGAGPFRSAASVERAVRPPIALIERTPSASSGSATMPKIHQVLVVRILRSSPGRGGQARAPVRIWQAAAACGADGRHRMPAFPAVSSRKTCSRSGRSAISSCSSTPAGQRGAADRRGVHPGDQQRAVARRSRRWRRRACSAAVSSSACGVRTRTGRAGAIAAERPGRPGPGGPAGRPR